MPMLRQMNPVHVLRSSSSKIHVNIAPSFQLHLLLPRGIFPSGSKTEILYAFFSHVHTTCLPHPILSDFITLIMFRVPRFAVFSILL
jgi:hypothetical protein